MPADLDLLADRDPCPNPLHDWPLPRNYVTAHEVARSRLAHGWLNRRCPDCGLFGWIEGRAQGMAGTWTRRVSA